MLGEISLEEDSEPSELPPLSSNDETEPLLDRDLLDLLGDGIGDICGLPKCLNELSKDLRYCTTLSVTLTILPRIELFWQLQYWENGCTAFVKTE